MRAVKVKRPIFTITISDMHALCDRLMLAGSTRKVVSRCDIQDDLRLAGAVIRMLLTHAPARDSFRLFAEDDP